MKKWIKWIAVSLLLLIVLSLLIVYFSLNSIIRSVVQTQATASLNVPTTLNSVALSLFGGQLVLGDLEVGSPPSFSAPHTLVLDGCSVAVQYGQLRSTPIHISHITLNHPVIYVEQSNLKLNIQALMDQQSQTPQSSSGQPSQPISLIIDQLDVNNAQVNFLPGLPGMNTPIQVQIPSLTLTNVGNANGNDNGVAIKQVVVQVLAALVAKAGDVAKLPPELQSFLTNGLGNITQQLGGVVNQQLQNVGGVLNNAGKQGGNTANNVGNALNGLFGGQKKN